MEMGGQHSVNSNMCFLWSFIYLLPFLYFYRRHCVYPHACSIYDSQTQNLLLTVTPSNNSLQCRQSVFPNPSDPYRLLLVRYIYILQSL